MEDRLPIAGRVASMCALPKGYPVPLPTSSSAVLPKTIRSLTIGRSSGSDNLSLLVTSAAKEWLTASNIRINSLLSQHVVLRSLTII